VSTGFDYSKVVILKDKEHSSQWNKSKDAKLQTLLNENSSQTLKELAEALNVSKSIISDRLYAKIQKANEFYINWIDYLKSSNYLEYLTMNFD